MTAPIEISQTYRASCKIFHKRNLIKASLLPSLFYFLILRYVFASSVYTGQEWAIILYYWSFSDKIWGPDW